MRSQVLYLALHFTSASTLYSFPVCISALSASAFLLHQKEKKRKDYTSRRQFNEKPSIIPGCPAFFIRTHDAPPVTRHHHSLCARCSLRQSAVPAPLCGLTAVPVLLPSVCPQDGTPSVSQVTLTISMKEIYVFVNVVLACRTAWGGVAKQAPALTTWPATQMPTTAPACLGRGSLPARDKAARHGLIPRPARGLTPWATPLVDNQR